MGIFSGSSERSPQDQIDLADLKERVARLEATVAQLLARLDAAPAPDGSVAPAPAAPSEAPWMQEVRLFKQQGKLINAIKVYREHTQVGLKEAKDAVEALP